MSEAVRPRHNNNNMKIKIKSSNIAALQAALEKANGNAIAHTYRHASQILEVAVAAEAQLQSLNLSKNSRSGVIATANSGGSVANAYKYSRITSTATLVRGSSDWFLTSISASESFRKTAGGVHVSLTPSQDSEVTAKFRAQFLKQPVTVGAAT